MEICPAVVDCDQMPQEVFYEDDGDNHGTDDERMVPFKDEVNKIEGLLTRALNALINITWRLNPSQYMYSMWCVDSSLNLPIGDACHMQSWVF